MQVSGALFLRPRNLSGAFGAGAEAFPQGMTRIPESRTGISQKPENGVPQLRCNMQTGVFPFETPPFLTRKRFRIGTFREIWTIARDLPLPASESDLTRYPTSRLVAVSGNTIHGLNVLASSKSICA